ncbi:MAG: UDP-N-acetylmuramate dehydrogenase [Acidimicrobiaceae bacterium]|nr:UDP-N-acetylmuramate dehydrogenase [Acidimicrobiaceae bacterium]
MTSPAQSGSLNDVAEMLRSSRLSQKTQFNAPVGPLTTYRVGGCATALVTVDTREDLTAFCELLAGTRGSSDVALSVVGRGSNLLVSDDGFAGIAVVLGRDFAEVGVRGTAVGAGAAAKLPVVARACANAGLAGFEWAVGVPGSVGGAVRMNAGGHGAEIKDSLTSAQLVDLRSGSYEWRSNKDLEFGYRSSSVRATELVLEARFELVPGDSVAGKAKLLEIVQWRRANQPGGQNAGSVFTNPDGDSAGRLIESVGAKGLRIGTAEVSMKHSNFIQADENGRAGDILALMKEIQRLVFECHGIELLFETQLLGFDDRSDNAGGADAEAR